jgi:hypothetical protein
METSQLVQEADLAIEEYRFSDAIRILRTICTTDSASPRDFGNLVLAEQQEIISFRRMLVQRRPQDLICRFAEINALRQGRMIDQVMSRCQDLIAMTDDPLTRYRARSARIEAACEFSRYESLVEDFLEIWNADFPNASKCRPQLATDLARISSPTAVPALTVLLKSESLPDELKVLIAMKIDFLCRLQAYRKSLKEDSLM